LMLVMILSLKQAPAIYFMLKDIPPRGCCPRHRMPQNAADMLDA
jgi:hypothetical protein